MKYNSASNSFYFFRHRRYAWFDDFSMLLNASKNSYKISWHLQKLTETSLKLFWDFIEASWKFLKIPKSLWKKLKTSEAVWKSFETLWEASEPVETLLKACRNSLIDWKGVSHAIPSQVSPKIPQVIFSNYPWDSCQEFSRSSSEYSSWNVSIDSIRN